MDGIEAFQGLPGGKHAIHRGDNCVSQKIWEETSGS
ncbi:hypothetical protein BSS2_I0382 [Brucella suis bv. 1 str. S2]|uniref:Uncharacterized protein n=3 Tax=Brucella TaxID=234 RepID=Q2YMB9_BRUA2|nr:hypothetical protein BR0390 [Brucella suis 1330]ACU47403.1 hypothetical protein BMI_I394 [Brucella microti CCM 4915]AEU05417.1 hypothetical protein BSVBI22_A0391 [Brucella suis VBI22]AHN46045.1 hypothetical protein BSS2_I0382 [Brucella suis bv. 1 str. S2]CAJ10375.1 conserved hypothetical protein [Brucella abortus 2308]CDL75803.1 unnamed protein product [Brucella canis str. Oliveri]SHO30234.1 predicted protein [Brucella abortus]